MIEYKKLEHSDYDDIVELCKDIWDGTDYLPELFHDWVDARGLFLGAVDTGTGKVVGADKYSVLHDDTGWLEGLRVHKDYRGKKIASELAERVLQASKKDLQEGKIDKIAFSTHISAVESISMMKNRCFRLEQSYILVMREYDSCDPNTSASSFEAEPWDLSYEEFASLPYIRKRNNLLPFAFYFQKPTLGLYKELKEDGCFVKINGYRGIYKLKGEPHIACIDECFEGIDAFISYYLSKLKGVSATPPLTAVTAADELLIRQLKEAGYSTLDNWKEDYLYFVYDKTTNQHTI